MRLLVCGSRKFESPFTIVARKLFEISSTTPITAIIHGGAMGADLAAGIWAIQHRIEEIVFKPDWTKHGKAAGPIRNQQMLTANPDMVLAFWNGTSKGTADMIGRAIAAGVKVEVVSVA